jgi:hypothetical protein
MSGWHLSRQAVPELFVPRGSTNLALLTVYNNDFDNSMGFGVGKDLPYQEIEFGKAIKCDGLSARYVRIYTRGSSWTHLTRFVEIEVYGFLARR